MNKFKYKIFILIIVSLLFNQNFSRINNIKIEGNIRFSDEDVIRISSIYPGMNYDLGRVEEGIKKLWDLNRFNDVKIIIADETLDGINIIIRVEEAKLLNNVIINGNKKLRKNKIKDIGGIETGQILTNKSIFDAKNKIIREYKKRGYHNIIINEKLVDTNHIEFASDLIFEINEGKHLKLKKITINGNSIVSDRKIKNIFKNNKEWKFYFPWKGKFKEEEIENDNLILISYLKDRGFKDFFIKNYYVNINNNDIELIYDLYEGPKYFYHEIFWEGNKIVSNQDLNEAFTVQKGEVFNLKKFNISLYQNVYSLYMDKGYINLFTEYNFKYLDNNFIDVSFNIVENDIVTVRNIIIEGNIKTNENVIRREIDIYPGDIFNRTKFIDVRTKIMLLNFFDNVIPDIRPVNNNEVDLIIEVSEKGVGQANFSMGWNKVQGFNGGGGFQMPNFLGRGQTISISYNRGINTNTNYNVSDVSTTSIAQSFSLSYFEPALYDTPNMVGVSFSYYENPGTRTISGLDVNNSSISISFGRRKLQWPDDKFTIRWIFTKSNRKYSTYDKDRLENSFPFISNNSIELNNDRYSFNSSGVSLSQIIKRRSFNHPEFPTKGSEFIWDFTYSGGALGGIEDYIKNIITFNWYIEITEKMAIANIFKFGNIEKTSNNSVIPPQRYFIMGGSGIPYGERLRGYPENSIGPYYYENNYPVGGKLLSRYSIEYRIKFSESPTMYGFVFADAGNVWSGYDFIDPFDLKRSGGIGIRLFMPMLGLIGYDIGYGFDSSSYGQDDVPWGWDHHLIFGTAF